MRTAISPESRIDDRLQGSRRTPWKYLARRALDVLTVFALGLAALPAHADGWTSDCTITNLYVAGQNNFQYRVFGMPGIASCTSGQTWGYVNDADPGSQGFVAAILSAYNTGKLIRLNIQTVNGFCHIIELFVSG